MAIIPCQSEQLPERMTVPDIVLSARVFRLLYIFAGDKRKSDIEDCVQRLALTLGFTASCNCIDLLRRAEDNILIPGLWENILHDIKSGLYQAVVITPPCNTFSRARNANRRGPPPLRSRSHAKGFPWLFGRFKQQVELGNQFVEIVVEGFKAAVAANCVFLGEHPEDLGVSASGDVPASIWAWEEVLTIPNTKSGALFQCLFGSISSKATRLISSFDLRQPLHADEGFPEACFWKGWPKFDKKFRYIGPLPRNCGHSHPPQIGFEADGKFKTSKLSAYPPKLCMWISRNLIEHSFIEPRPKGGDEPLVQFPLSSSVLPLPAPVPQPAKSSPKLPRNPDFQSATPKPLSATWGGKAREFHDGFNLQSPGRYHPDSRPSHSWGEAGKFLLQLIKLVSGRIPRMDILCFSLATGKQKDNPFQEDLLEEARSIWFKFVKTSSDLSLEQLGTKTEFQPFYLFAIGETLRLMGDADHGIFFREANSFSSGVPVGYKSGIDRVAEQYEEKSKFRKYDESFETEYKENYRSATAEILETQFAEEVELGHMFSITLGEARKRWSTVRVAAQGALEKSETEFRIIHDGTHGVNINNHIVNPNLQRFPGPAEQREIMTLCSTERPGVHFGIQADVSKAHRRFLHREADLGLLACTTVSGPVCDDSLIFINRVGTFGIASASFWWGRLCAGVGRMAQNLLGLRFKWFFMLMFADDSRQQAWGAEKYLALVMSLFLWSMAGTPFSWKKCKGGLKGDWLGYWLDYEKFEIGVSEKRCAWLLKWAKKILADKLVLISSMAEGLGRLCFVSGVVEYYRPFLAPMFAWTASAPAGAVLPVPPMVLLTLNWIAKELETGRRTTSHISRPTNNGEIFCTDTKAEDDFIILGGWKSEGGVLPQDAEWFSLKLTKEQVPWLFEKGHGSRTIAASELMATMVGVHLFVPDASDRGDSVASFVATAVDGITDNQGNSYVIKKLLSTKLPLCAVVMQLASILAKKSVWLNLQWKPREENTLADALTNQDYSSFDLGRRRSLEWEDIPKDVMEQVSQLVTGFVEELESRKRAKRTEGSSGRGKRRKKIKDWRNVWGA